MERPSGHRVLRTSQHVQPMARLDGRAARPFGVGAVVGHRCGRRRSIPRVTTVRHVDGQPVRAMRAALAVPRGHAVGAIGRDRAVRAAHRPPMHGAGDAGVRPPSDSPAARSADDAVAAGPTAARRRGRHRAGRTPQPPRARSRASAARAVATLTSPHRPRRLPRYDPRGRRDPAVADTPVARRVSAGRPAATATRCREACRSPGGRPDCRRRAPSDVSRRADAARSAAIGRRHRRAAARAGCRHARAAGVAVRQTAASRRGSAARRPRPLSAVPRSGGGQSGGGRGRQPVRRQPIAAAASPAAAPLRRLATREAHRILSHYVIKIARQCRHRRAVHRRGAARHARPASSSPTPTTCPQISALDDYAPSTITRVLGADGDVIGEFAVERRVVIRYDQIPERAAAGDPRRRGCRLLRARRPQHPADACWRSPRT